jgi:hypothetical protein
MLIHQIFTKYLHDKTWANELNILAMAIVLDRPIAIWSHFVEKSNNTRVT